MTIVEFFTLLGGLSMFLFGMRVMGDALEKRAGNQLKSILEKLTSSTFKGFLLGLGVTLIIQSSSATTVMVVGFVNSGLMTLHQATGVIMGANLGTSVTAWLLSTSGIQGEGILQLFKPESFAPLFAFIGIILYMFQKNRKRQDIGLIFIGFGVLMIGMELMADAVTSVNIFDTILLYKCVSHAEMAGVVLLAGRNQMVIDQNNLIRVPYFCKSHLVELVHDERDHDVI